ncbi:Variant-specific surface protein [Giardia duodenalis]|uniref:Variant-specific surface protein n=1 Tax=Giardia intestinalis TaxID=5741 RepID=V6TNS3_GIAIN|nr:Variant-specific surface protein [Giardia intestinalis]
MLAGRYCSVREAPGGGVCREARDGACVRHAEEVTGRTKKSMRVREAQAGCTTGSSSTDHCASDKCDVTIGDKTYCSQCEANYVPIDGTCTQVGDDIKTKCLKADGSALENTDTQCGQCGAGYFLHKGCCYKKGQDPGQAICKDTADTTAGICQDCQAGYFKNPANVATSDSCIACGDATGVIVSGGATYKGVLNCAVCTAPQAGGSGEVATCTVCMDGYYGADCTNSCDKSCKSCTGAGTAACTSCKDPSPYFKKGDGETGECVADETACKDSNTHFLVADMKTCYPCGSVSDGGVADCQTCTSSESGGAAKAVTVTCSACTAEGRKPNADGTKCVDCAAVGCAKCSDEGVCVECSTDKLTPTAQCVDSCDKLGGYYADGNVCKPCSPECASCSTAGNNKCLSCPAGKVLKYIDETKPNEGGICVDECKVNTGGCADCGAVIGGSRYCSKCGDASQAPLNGDCAANTAKTKFCTTVKDGACTQCKSGYFLLDGGCYQTTRQPGSQVCTQAGNNGQCTKCANEQTPDSSTGVCPACPTGCSTCSDTSTCTACLAGYYLSSSKCVKCDKNSTDNKITGVENCVSCAPPASSGTVTCYVAQSPTVDPTDPSVNKGGLSSGAIAGISMAVIAVARGLVGFLCWWFVCRGKA